jgi:hypothetical protein
MFSILEGIEANEVFDANGIVLLRYGEVVALRLYHAGKDDACGVHYITPTRLSPCADHDNIALFSPLYKLRIIAYGPLFRVVRLVRPPVRSIMYLGEMQSSQSKSNPETWTRRSCTFPGFGQLHCGARLRPTVAEPAIGNSYLNSHIERMEYMPPTGPKNCSGTNQEHRARARASDDLKALENR